MSRGLLLSHLARHVSLVVELHAALSVMAVAVAVNLICIVLFTRRCLKERESFGTWVHSSRAAVATITLGAALDLRVLPVLFSRLLHLQSLSAPVTLHTRQYLLALVAVASMIQDVPQVALFASLLIHSPDGHCVTGRRRV